MKASDDVVGEGFAVDSGYNSEEGRRHLPKTVASQILHQALLRSHFEGTDSGPPGFFEASRWNRL